MRHATIGSLRAREGKMSSLSSQTKVFRQVVRTWIHVIKEYETLWGARKINTDDVRIHWNSWSNNGSVLRKTFIEDSSDCQFTSVASKILQGPHGQRNCYLEKINLISFHDLSLVCPGLGAATMGIFFYLLSDVVYHVRWLLHGVTFDPHGVDELVANPSI